MTGHVRYLPHNQQQSASSVNGQSTGPISEADLHGHLNPGSNFCFVRLSGPDYTDQGAQSKHSRSSREGKSSNSEEPRMHREDTE